MAKFVQQIIDAGKTRIETALPAKLITIATELSLTIEAPAVVFTERRAFSRQYPHVQLYPIRTEFPDDEQQNSRGGTHILHCDAHIRGADEATIEKITRAYLRGLDDILFGHTFSGLVHTAMVRDHNYFDSTKADGASVFIGGGRLLLVYKLIEALS